MKQEWLFPNAFVPVNAETTAALVTEIKRLIDVVGGMALAQQEQEPVAWMTINAYGEEDDIHYENPEGHLLEGWTYKPLYTRPPIAQPEQEPVSMRLPKAGDKVICLEDDSLATVVSLTAGGSPDIVFSDGSRGTYLLNEFAELFGYVAPPQQQAEPVEDATMQSLKDLWRSVCDEVGKAAFAQPEQEPVAQVHPNHLKHDGNPWCREVLLYSGNYEGGLLNGENYRVKLYTTPPQRQPLTDEAQANARLIDALRMAVRQNEVDMVMTGEECRQCHAAIDKAIRERGQA